MRAGGQCVQGDAGAAHIPGTGEFLPDGARTGTFLTSEWGAVTTEIEPAAALWEFRLCYQTLQFFQFKALYRPLVSFLIGE